MAEANVTTQQAATPAPRRRRWPKIIGLIFLIFVLLLVAAYFVGTSSAFFKGVILPRASRSLNADITVSDASISPFKEVVLHNLQVKTTGEEPLVSAPEVRAHYSLIDIIRGDIKVDDVEVSKPVVVIVENPDGSKNTDPLTKSKAGEKPSAGKAAEPSAAPAEQKKPSKPIHLDLKKLALTDATVRQIKLYAGGKKDVTELSHVNITLDDLKNGGTGKLAIASDIRVENNPPPNVGTNGTLEAKLNGNFSLALSPDLKPAAVQGKARLDVNAAADAFGELNTLAADINCDVTPTEVKEVALRFSKANANLGEVHMDGPFNMETTTGKLNVAITSLDKHVLNLAGAKSGLDFGPTTINSTNQVEITKSPSSFAIHVLGELNVSKFQVTRQQQTTPSIDLTAKYDDTIDRTAQTELLKAFSLSGVQNGRPLLTAELTSPMVLSLGSSNLNVGDSSLNLVVTNLNLADWKPFVGDVAPSGVVNVTTKLLAQQGGKLLNFDFNTAIADLAVVSGTNEIKNLSVTVHVGGTGRDLKQFTLAEYKAQVARQNQTLATISGTGTYDVTNKAADLQVNAQASVPLLLQTVSPTNQTVSAGTIDLKAHVIQKQDTQGITGNLALNDLSARLGSNQLRNFTAAIDLDVGHTPQKIELRRVSGSITQAGKPGGSFDLTGTYLTNKSADIKLTKATFNQDGVRPFLQSALGDKQLVSIAINASAGIQYDPSGASAIKADAQVSNLVVKDPKNQFPETPLEAKLAIDTAIKKQMADINKFLITLTPTQRAKNELQLAGHIDFSNTNYTQGNLKLTADAMDVTSYYDLFAKDNKATAAKTGAKGSARSPASSQPAPPAETADANTTAQANKEPDPKKLPVNNFTLDANIGHFYLREVDLAELQTQAKIDVSHVVLNPLKVKINGGPLNTTADIDLSVPGYKYKLDFGAQNIPLAPLVNSFQPDRKGEIGGTLLAANAKIDGAGITGASLQKSLNGQFDINSTNLNLSVDKVRSRLVKVIINVVASVPDLLHGNIGGLVESITSLGNGGLMGELKKSPIDVITARGVAGSGKIELQQAVVQSAAFRADAHGTVTLAPVLDNSPVELPVGIALGRPLAQRLSMGGADTNAAYVSLPDFVLIEGTVGDPKPNKRKLLVLAAAAGKGLINIIPGSSATGNLIKEGLNLFGGNSAPSPTGTNAPPPTGTNPPSTQASTNKTQNLLNNALDLFNRKKNP